MGLNDTFKFPKRTITEQVLDKHHVEAKYYRNNDTGENYYFLVPTYDNIYDTIANINEGLTGVDHYSNSIKGNNGETLRQLLLRLEWVKIGEDGKAYVA